MRNHYILSSVGFSPKLRLGVSATEMSQCGHNANGGKGLNGFQTVWKNSGMAGHVRRTGLQPLQSPGMTLQSRLQEFPDVREALCKKITLRGTISEASGEARQMSSR